MTPEPGWKFTGKNTKDGRPIWACRVCNARIWGWRVADHSCLGTPAAKPKAAEVPCKHRGLVYAKINDVSCGCKATVFSCSVHAFCTISPINGTIQNIIPKCCIECDNREE